MKQFGILATQQLVSLPVDDHGAPIFTRPHDAGEQWIPPVVVPLVKHAQPVLQPGRKAEAKLVWFADRVERRWEIVDKTKEELEREREEIFPEAEMYQVREWMIDRGFDPKRVPGLIEQAILDPQERAKALNRWETAVRVPRPHPLCNLIGSLMEPPMTPAEIDDEWPGILRR